MKYNNSNIYLVVVALLLPNLALSATPIYERDSYFPGVAQGHSRLCTSHSSSQLTMYNDTKIKGTNGAPLDFCAHNKNGYPIDGCEDGYGGYTECSLTKTNRTDIPLPAFKTSSSKTSYSCNNGGNYTFNNASYKNISSNKATCSFVMSNAEQRIKNLSLNGGTLTLHSGDYWVQNLHINSVSQIYIEGDVRLFVKNGLGIYNDSFIKKNEGASFSLYSYNNIHIESDASIEGDVYASNNLVLDDTSHIIGRTLSESLRLNSNAYIEDSDSAPLPPVPVCYNDNFDNSDLTGRWITSSSSGNFIPHVITDPYTNDKRLRLTENKKNQSTASSFQYRFPSAGNKIEIEFDYMAHGGGRTGADGLAIVFSDFKKTPQAGAFGGPLGYGFKQHENKPGFNGGWLGVGLDEYGNYSREGGSKNHTPGSSTAQSIVLRGSGDQFSGFNYIDGTKVSTDIDDNTGKNTVHRYRITIDSTKNNKANVTVERSITSRGSNPRFTKIVGPIDVLKNQYNQADVPDDFLLSLTGSTGSATNIHEIDNFRVCALDVQPVGDQIDHFEFDHSAIGSTCNTSDITLRACADPDCDTLFTNDVNVTLNSNTLGGDGFWEGGNQITMRNGIAGLSLGKLTSGTAKLDVSGSSPATKPFSSTLCRINGENPSINNCTVTFKEDGLTLKVPDKLANKPITATLQGCAQYTYSGIRDIEFTSNYIAPNKSELKTNSSGKTPQVTVFNGISWLPLDATTPTTLSLNFQNNEAKFQLNYPDAGKLQLNAKDKNNYAQPMGFGSFVSFPVGLTANVTNKSNQNGRCIVTNPTLDNYVNCAVFAKAGEEFSLNVTAHAWQSDNDSSFSDNLVTPNYTQEHININHYVVSPSLSEGGNAGMLKEFQYTHYASSNGQQKTDQYINEVGVFDIIVKPPFGYLGSTAYAIQAARTGSIGRFTPAYFNSLAQAPTINNGCGDFTYMSQNLTFSKEPTLTLLPYSLQQTETRNYYVDNWWRYNNKWLLRTYQALDSGIEIIDTDLSTAEGFAKPGSVDRVSKTSNQVTLSSAEIRYKKPILPIAPTNDTIKLTLDAEDLKDSDGICYQKTPTGACEAFDFPVTAAHTQQWGRIAIDDAYGSELSNIEAPIRTEYYNGVRFTLSDDSCTPLTMSNFSFDVGNNPEKLPIGEGFTKAELPNSASDVTMEKGKTSLNFKAPGAGNTGEVKPTLSLSPFPWLRPNQDKDNAFESSVDALVHFGIYRGSDRIIWSHEQIN